MHPEPLEKESGIHLANAICVLWNLLLLKGHRYYKLQK